jgi:hypothetical protein
MAIGKDLWTTGEAVLIWLTRTRPFVTEEENHED